MAARKFTDLIPDFSEGVGKAMRQASVKIMNDLAQAGPAYSGKFSSAWYAAPKGGSVGINRSTGKIYKYDLRNVPKTKFKSLVPGSYYEIANGMSYAPQALDLQPGEFTRPNSEPIQDEDKIKRGVRQKQIRGNIKEGKGGNLSTAPLNWYATYVRGGGLERSFEFGVKLGFREFQRGFGR